MCESMTRGQGGKECVVCVCDVVGLLECWFALLLVCWLAVRLVGLLGWVVWVGEFGGGLGWVGHWHPGHLFVSSHSRTLAPAHLTPAHLYSLAPERDRRIDRWHDGLRFLLGACDIQFVVMFDDRSHNLCGTQVIVATATCPLPTAILCFCRLVV